MRTIVLSDSAILEAGDTLPADVLGQIGNERYHFKSGCVARPEQGWMYVQPPFFFYLNCNLLFFCS